MCTIDKVILPFPRWPLSSWIYSLYIRTHSKINLELSSQKLSENHLLLQKARRKKKRTSSLFRCPSCLKGLVNKVLMFKPLNYFISLLLWPFIIFSNFIIFSLSFTPSHSILCTITTSSSKRTKKCTRKGTSTAYVRRVGFCFFS